MIGVLRSEWSKALSTRASAATLPLTVLLCAGLAYPIALAYRNIPGQHEWGDDLQLRFASLLVISLGQLVLVVFAVMAVGGEFSTGAIRSSLTAVPSRGRFFAAKAAAVGLLALVVAVPSVASAYVSSSLALGSKAPGLGEAEMIPALLGAVGYLVLICLFAAGVTALLRSSVLAMSILLPLLFLESQGLGSLPGISRYTQYLPAEAGMSMMHLVRDDGSRFAHDYGPLAGFGLLALWTALVLLGGYLVNRRRDV